MLLAAASLSVTLTANRSHLVIIAPDYPSTDQHAMLHAVAA